MESRGTLRKGERKRKGTWSARVGFVASSPSLVVAPHSAKERRGPLKTEPGVSLTGSSAVAGSGRKPE